MRPPIVLPGIVAGGMSPEAIHTLDRNASRGENLRNYFAALRIFFAAEAGTDVDEKKLDTWRWYVDALTLKLVGAVDGETAAAAKAKALVALELDGLALGAVLACKTGEELAALQQTNDPKSPVGLLMKAQNERKERESMTTEQGTVNIAGIDKAALLAALYNGSRPIGMGHLRAEAAAMTPEEAAEYVGDPKTQDNGQSGRMRLFFDYVKGRPLKVDLDGDILHTRLYNRDNGEGAAERVVAKLREAEGGDTMRAPSP